jgi:hypothetical protein
MPLTGFGQLLLPGSSVIIVGQLPKERGQEPIFRNGCLFAASPRHVLGVETAYHAFSRKK